MDKFTGAGSNRGGSSVHSIGISNKWTNIGYAIRVRRKDNSEEGGGMERVRDAEGKPNKSQETIKRK